MAFLPVQCVILSVGVVYAIATLTHPSIARAAARATLCASAAMHVGHQPAGGVLSAPRKISGVGLLVSLQMAAQQHPALAVWGVLLACAVHMAAAATGSVGHQAGHPI